MDRERWLVWNGDTLDKLEEPALALPEGLVAVYSQGTLYFDNYRNTNSLLDLSAYYRAATDGEIDTLVQEGPLTWQGNKPIQEVASQRCKGLMYMFTTKGGFSSANLNVTDVKNTAYEAGIDIAIELDENGAELISLPNNSKELTQLFEFLTQHYHRGIWDKLWRRTNSLEIVPGQRSSSP